MVNDDVANRLAAENLDSCRSARTTVLPRLSVTLAAALTNDKQADHVAVRPRHCPPLVRRDECAHRYGISRDPPESGPRDPNAAVPSIVPSQ